MNFKTIAVSAAGLLFTNYTAQKMTPNLKYPETKKIDHFDDYFGTKVNDSYRWLEDDRAEDTKDWVNREVTFTKDYLAKIPFREEIPAQ